MKDFFKNIATDFLSSAVGWLLTTAFLAPLIRIPWGTILLFPAIHWILQKSLDELATYAVLLMMGEKKGKEWQKGLKVAIAHVAMKEAGMEISACDIAWRDFVSSISQEQFSKLITVLDEEQISKLSFIAYENTK